MKLQINYYQNIMTFKVNNMQKNINNLGKKVISFFFLISEPGLQINDFETLIFF